MSNVQESQQIEHIRSMIKKYGSIILCGIIVVAFGIGCWSYWEKRQHVDNEKNTATVQQLINDTQQADSTTALSGFSATADKISQDFPDSVQAILAQLVIADQAYQRKDYASAEKALLNVSTSKIDDDGLLAIVNIRLANVQFAQDHLDDALATLSKIKNTAFNATVEERKGDIFVAKKEIESAQKAYQAAWDALIKREEDSQILRMKLESTGIVIDEPNIPQPILHATMEQEEITANKSELSGVKE